MSFHVLFMTNTRIIVTSYTHSRELTKLDFYSTQKSVIMDTMRQKKRMKDDESMKSTV